MFSSRQVARSEGSRYRVSNRAPWSPSQIVVGIVGLVFIVLGGVGLARAGVHFDAVPFSRTQVAGLWFTNMSALITLIAGVILLVGAIDPDSAKATMWFFGVVLIAFGLIVAISPQPFTNMWGYDTASGVFYVVAGAVLIIGGAVSPVFYSRQAVMSQRQIVDDDSVAHAPPSPPAQARPVTYQRDDQLLRH
jgi:formate hydrogenlyase subunit 3/multisubunit Na+/H+ antiporter MnhD subunit